MNPELKEITQNVYFISTKDYHRPLFDNLMPLHEGTSYNAYIIKSEDKNVLIDTTYPPFIDDFDIMLKENNIDKIDYIVSLHGEQDHTGALPNLLKKFPDAKIVTNQKCKDITIEFLPLKDDDYIIVEDNEILDLGGKTLQFIMAPWVHWPDTMFAHLKEDDILFSTDFFGAHATNFEQFWDSDPSLIPLIKSYYAEIMMPYATFVKKHLTKVKEINPKIIAPSHGPIYKNPNFIIDLYEKWTSDKKENKVVILGVTMYGSTQEMINYITKNIKNKGIDVVYYDAINCNSSDFASDIVDATGIIVASPTVLAGPHPAVIMPLYLTNLIKPGLKYLGVIGSYSWGTAMDKQIPALLSNLKQIDVIEPVLVKGTATAEDFTRLDNLIEKIANIHS